MFIVAYFSSWIMTIDKHTKNVSTLCINKTKTAFDIELYYNKKGVAMETVRVMLLW